MAEFCYRGVNDAFAGLVRTFHTGEYGRGVFPNDLETRTAPLQAHGSRDGATKRFTEPVVIKYERPLERVLFNPVRDVSPALLIYEAMWMLAGREDLAPLVYYSKNFARFTDDGVTVPDAYGKRWRGRVVGTSRPATAAELAGTGQPAGTVEGYERVDQLDHAVELLRDPDTRRCVVTMWEVEDLLKAKTSKGVPCNLMVKFKVRHEPDGNRTGTGPGSFLDMTVFNRSNDLVMGTLGANLVTFSVLLEYMTARLGCEVGTYWQISDDLHAYDRDMVKAAEWLAWYEGDEAPLFEYDGVVFDRDKRDPVLVPLVKDPAVFDKELPAFVEYHSKSWDGGNPDLGTQEPPTCYSEPFLDTVAHPLLNAFHAHKRKDREAALAWAGLVRADDWRVCITNWLTRRYAKEAK